MTLLAIDFGSANTRVMSVPGRGEPSPSMVHTTASVAAFGEGRIEVGETVLLMAGAVDDLVVRDLKRLLGRSPSDPLVRRTCQRGGYVATTDERGLLRLACRSGQATIADGVQALLGHAARLANQQPGSEPSEAVIVIPRWAGPQQQAALLEAAQRAGLTVIAFILDTAATVFWHTHQRGSRGNIAAIDIGAGGLGLCIAHCDGQRLELRAALGSAEHGGDDVDAELAETAVGAAEPQVWELVRQACESMKRELGGADSATRSVHMGAGESDKSLHVERWELELLLNKLTSFIDKRCHELLAQAELKAGELDRVLMTGGMSALAPLVKPVAGMFGAPTTIVQDHPNAALLGACLFAMAQRQPGVARVQLVQNGAVLRPTAERSRTSTRRPGAAWQQRTGQPPSSGGARPAGRDSSPLRRSGPSSQHTNQRRSEPPRRANTRTGQAGSTRAPNSSERGAVSSHRKPVRNRPEVTRRMEPGRRRGSRTAQPPESSPPWQTPAPENPQRRRPGLRRGMPTHRQGSVPPTSAAARSSEGPSSSSATPAPGSSDRQPSRPPVSSQPRSSDPRRRRSVIPDGSADVQLKIPAPGSAGGPRSQPLSMRPMKRSGQLRTPQTAAEILAMPISRPLTEADLEPVALPVLLRRLLSKRTVSGTLLLTAGKVSVTIDLAAGTGALEKNAHAELMKIFEIEEGSWELRSERDETVGRKAYSLPRLALDGTRRMLRQLQPDALTEALGHKLPLTPTLRPEKRALPNRMGLNSRELRFLEMHMDGASTGQHIVQYGGLGKATALQLLMLLELFDVLDWEQPRAKQERPLEERLAEMAHDLERKTYFEVLGIHWSAPEEELQAAYVSQKDTYRKGSANDGAAPQACAQIRSRIELAFENLNTGAKRAAYRKVALEGFDFEAVTDLAEKRSASLIMRGDVKAAANSEETAKELSMSIDKSLSGRFEQTMAELERRFRSSQDRAEPEDDTEDR